MEITLFDSHCHLDDKSYDDDLNEVVQRAKDEGVQGMLLAGVDVDTCLKALKIAAQFDQMVVSVGMHPHEAKNCRKEEVSALADLALSHSNVKAWGETGLDFNRMFSPVKDQETSFVLQLEKAGELDLPLIFHERDSKGRFYDIVRTDGPDSRKGVVHCFSGTKKEMFQYLDLDYYIGITGILTLLQRGEYLRSIVPHIPKDRILIETDAPYLTPAPQKNKTRRNEPAFVKSVLLKLAQVRQEDPQILSREIFDNTCRLFNLTF